MTKETKNDTDLAYADTLWKSVDTLRGQIDPAEYKHVVLGLLFLKYISDSFEARKDELTGNKPGKARTFGFTLEYFLPTP